MAENKDEAVKSFDAFTETYGTKYPKAVERLEKDQGCIINLL
jgi:transposase-like protein